MTARGSYSVRMAAGESDPGPAQRTMRTLDGVLAHIEAHLNCPLPLTGLAAMAGLSIWRFSTVFRQRLGLPPHRYIRKQRVRLAQTLLRKGMPVAFAASEAGFYDQSHLARCFRDACNMTPRQYQAQFRPSSQRLFQPRHGAETHRPESD